MRGHIVFNNHHRTKYLASLLLLVILFTSCHQRRTSVIRGFYYWKTQLQLSNYEQQRLTEAGCKKIYIRCFDVGWNEITQHPEPVAALRILQKPSTKFYYVPVVFITQETIAKLKSAQIAELSNHIASLLASISKELTIDPKEIQIDCDWTQQTKATYFSLLNNLRKTHFFRHKKLSCTIRLHQVKFSLRSGIPPVDRGLIMCYNIGNLKQPGAHNSILDISLARDYLQNLSSYPLPVDVALPLYSWCLHFRQGRLQGILRNVAPESVLHNGLFQSIENNLYSCTHDSIWQGYHFLKNDEIRVETPDRKDLQALADFTAKAIRNDSLSVLFFHIDSLTLAKYSIYDLEAVYNAYR